MKYYLINLDANEICATADTAEELVAIGEKNTWSYHVANVDIFAGCTLADLAKYYNTLPGATEKVQRFSDRAAGLRRLQAMLERGLCPIRSGKKAVKTRKKGAGRRSGWETVAVSAAGKAEDLKFHRENARFKVFEVIKRREETTRDALIKFCEDSLGIKRAQVMGAVCKLVARKLVNVKP